MARVFRTIGTVYGASCVVCSAYVVPKAYTYIWNELYNSLEKHNIESTNTLCTKVVTTSVTLSIIPSVCMWSPVIAAFLLTQTK